MHLTEHCAITPAASVSGLLFGSPKARYFTIGPIGRDQVKDYAGRSGQSVAETERWLAPNLAYDPEPSKEAEGPERTPNPPTVPDENSLDRKQAADQSFQCCRQSGKHRQ